MLESQEGRRLEGKEPESRRVEEPESPRLGSHRTREPESMRAREMETWRPGAGAIGELEVRTLAEFEGWSTGDPERMHLRGLLGVLHQEGKAWSVGLEELAPVVVTPRGTTSGSVTAPQPWWVSNTNSEAVVAREPSESITANWRRLSEVSGCTCILNTEHEYPYEIGLVRIMWNSGSSSSSMCPRARVTELSL